jgi:hypothetical protein
LASKRSRIARGCALSAIASVAVGAVALLAAELWLRGPGSGSVGAAVLRGLYENDPERRGEIRTVAGYRTRILVEGRTTELRIDALGLRGPEIGARKPGERRLLALGDSMVFGLGVDES